MQAGLKRGRADDGAALVEMTIVVSLLFMLLFGIIIFSYVMSFRGSMAQAASEGARAAATAPRTGPGNTITNVEAYNRATTALQQAIGGFDRSCLTINGVDTDGDGLRCTATVHDCVTTSFNTATPPADTTFLPDCMTVRLDYRNQGSTSLMPVIPLVDAILPKSLFSASTVQLSNP